MRDPNIHTTTAWDTTESSAGSDRINSIKNEHPPSEYSNTCSRAGMKNVVGEHFLPKTIKNISWLQLCNRNPRKAPLCYAYPKSQWLMWKHLLYCRTSIIHGKKKPAPLTPPPPPKPFLITHNVKYCEQLCSSCLCIYPRLFEIVYS